MEHDTRFTDKDQLIDKNLIKFYTQFHSLIFKLSSLGVPSMNKQEFVSETFKICKRKNLNKRQVLDVIDAAFAVMGTAIRKEKRFFYSKFGTFVLKKRKGRIWKNPQSGKVISVKARNAVGFKPAQALKNALNGNGRRQSIKCEPKDFLQNFSSETNASAVKYGLGN